MGLSFLSAFTGGGGLQQSSSASSGPAGRGGDVRETRMGGLTVNNAAGPAGWQSALILGGVLLLGAFVMRGRKR
ncbi:MAG TPA: hypothetical protein ENJ79_07825 [Gammaproteobacteria bacterium]|nr:hypothetical protein [Gammaproteobacteria bacterium]